MKSVLFPLTLFFLFIYQDNNCKLKESLFKEILKDQSIKVFFEHKERFIIIDQTEKCFLKKNYFEIEKNIFEMPKGLVNDTLTIINYDYVSRDKICIEIFLFSKNSLYNAEFKIINSKVVELEKSSLSQIRQP